MRLCTVCAEVTDMTGAGIMLASAATFSAVCVTDTVSRVIESLQTDLGEGPGVDAHTGQAVVMESDLADPVFIRWPAFGASAGGGRAPPPFRFPPGAGGRRARGPRIL